MGDLVEFMLLFLGLDARDFSRDAEQLLMLVVIPSTLFSTKLCLGMVSVAEIRNVYVLLSNMLRVHKEQISDLSNNLSVAYRCCGSGTGKRRGARRRAWAWNPGDERETPCSAAGWRRLESSDNREIVNSNAGGPKVS